jgi:hypothetical protein
MAIKRGVGQGSDTIVFRDFLTTLDFHVDGKHVNKPESQKKNYFKVVGSYLLSNLVLWPGVSQPAVLSTTTHSPFLTRYTGVTTYS